MSNVEGGSENRVALITGASSGIGFEFAKVFAKNGFDLVLVARRKNLLEGLAQDILALAPRKIRVETIAADLSLADAPLKLKAETDSLGMNVTDLVNNAGFGEFGLFSATDWAREEKMIQLNVNALVYLTKLYLAPMQARRDGRILNVASTAAFQPGPKMAIYFATKAFVLSFSEAISEELRGTGVTVTALCPGATTSGFKAAANLDNSKLFKDRKIPSSAEVADFGYKSMQAGQVVAIHGWTNFAMAQSVRFSPRAMVRRLVGYMQDEVQ
jgi:uncharacterized protein